MATAYLSLLPSSLSFTPDRPSSSSSSSYSSFLNGGTPLRSHKTFFAVSSSSSSSSQFSKKPSAKPFGTVIAASADCYSTLGFPKSANSKEIKAAYRRLARQVVFPSFGERYLSSVLFESVKREAENMTFEP